MNKRIYLIAAMCLLGTLLQSTATAQVISSKSKYKPTWASSSFKRTLPNTYLEVVVVTGHDQKSITKDAEKEIIRRRKLTVGESDPWIKSGYIASYWESSASRITGYFLYQTRKNPTYEAEPVEATTEYGFSPRVFIPGAQQIWKGQGGKAVLFISGEVACIGGIVLSQSLKATYISKINSTHDNTQKRYYSNMANTWNMAGYGFITGAMALYAWNIIDGIVSPGRPTIKYDNNILTFAPAASPDYVGMSLTMSF
ncbi:MAG: hypothetical protein IJU81_01170 [Bacteroidales bacterium]|nr:hypothetical protein [Bacteroidales bacterium]